MPIARFQMPDGRVARFEVAEGTTPEQAEAAFEEWKAGVNAAVSPAPTSAKEQPKEPWYYLPKDAPLRKVYEDVKGRITESNILRPNEETAVRQTLQGAASGPIAGIVQEGASLLGNKELAGKIAQTAKEGNMLGSMLQPEMWLTGKAAGNFIEKGTGLLSKGLRAAPIGAAYGLTAATSDTENPEEARLKTAATAGAISFVSPAILKAAASGVGWAIDLLQGRLSAIKAGKVMRDVAGDELPKIQAALASAGDDVTAAQAAAPVESTKWSALGKRAAEQDSQFSSQNAKGQALARQSVMDRMAGGSTAESAAQARAQFLANAEQELGPRRVVYLAQLATPGQELSTILPKLNSLERQYVSALREGMPIGQAATGQATVHPTTEAAQSMVRNQQGAPGWISNADRAVEWGGAGREMATVAKGLRTEADALRQQISELPSVFTAAPVRDAVGAIAASTVNPAKKSVMDAVSNALEVAGDDPAKIAEIRKLGVNQLIGDLVQSGKVTKTDAAAALKDIRQVIDKQLGDDFVNKYLEPYSKKLANKDAMALADELRLMMKKSPKKFVEAMRGENPDLVSKFSATADTMAEALGEKRFKIASRAADEIARDLNLKKLAGEGTPELASILAKDASKVWIPAFVDWRAALARKIGDVAEGALDRKAMEKIYVAMRTGKTASELMNTMSTSEQNALLVAARAGALSPYLNSAVTAGAQ